MKITKISRAALLSIAIGISASQSVMAGKRAEPVIPISLAGLLFASELEAGQQISTVGYMEGPFLFLTKDHALILDYPSAIRVTDTSSEAHVYGAGCSDRYVRIYGRVHRSDAVNLELRDVLRIHDIAGKRDCYSRQ